MKVTDPNELTFILSSSKWNHRLGVSWHAVESWWRTIATLWRRCVYDSMIVLMTMQSSVRRKSCSEHSATDPYRGSSSCVNHYTYQYHDEERFYAKCIYFIRSKLDNTNRADHVSRRQESKCIYLSSELWHDRIERTPDQNFFLHSKFRGRYILLRMTYLTNRN